MGYGLHTPVFVKNSIILHKFVNYYAIFAKHFTHFMDIEFKDEQLKRLYQGEKVTDKKYRFPSSLISQYLKTIQRLIAAAKIEQLYQFHGLNYERLRGGLKGKSSVRINDKYRLIFEEITDASDPPKVVLLVIEEISNHYS